MLGLMVRRSVGVLVILWVLVAHLAAQGTVLPEPKAQFFSNTGAVLASGKLYSYACGTTTLQATYSDSALTSANANPTILDSAGRATVYLDAKCYKFKLDTSADVTLWTQDNVQQLFPWNGTTFTGTVKYLAPTTLTLSGNAVVPTRNVHALDTAGGAANLNTITATNFTTGAVLFFYGNNPGANPVTVKTGAGNITLAGGDYALNATNRFIALILQGTTWFEVARSAPTNVVSNGTCDGRITLTSGTAVTTADVLAATTVYFTPYKGNVCSLFDGTTWTPGTFAELSLSLGSDAANTNYDLWMFDNAGTKTLERLAWSTDTARATALLLQDGVWVKTGVTTRRYLGTYRTTGVAGQVEDSAAKRFVWNHYNRVPRDGRVVEATNTWTYTTATWRQANAATANQLAFVIGLAESELTVEIDTMAENSSIDVDALVAVGEDSTTVPTGNQIQIVGESPVASIRVPVRAVLRKWPAIGYHFYAWLERSEATGTTTWYGDNGDSTLFQSGIHGELK